MCTSVQYFNKRPRSDRYAQLNQDLLPRTTIIIGNLNAIDDNIVLKRDLYTIGNNVC